MDHPTVTTYSNGRASSPSDAVKPASPLADGDAVAAPTGFGLRRAATVNEPESRRRSGIFVPGNTTSFDSPAHRDSRRRSSTFSDYSLSEARRNFDQDIIDPGKEHQDEEDSRWASLPLAFAIVPAIGGIMFKNGSAMVTDVILLGLASIFLNWTLRSPFKWYRSAQQVREREENLAEEDLEDSDFEAGSSSEPNTPPKSGALDDVPEEQQPGTSSRRKANIRRSYADQRRRALRELYIHECVALFFCFATPMVGAYMLHEIRGYLTRPAEGIVSNFNIAIFVLAAEIWPCSTVIKLVRARTLHLQRVVNTNPYRTETVTPNQIQEILKRLEELETKGIANGAANGHTPNSSSVAPTYQGKSDAKIVKEVRNLIQPELDALNRAVRRYEKKATVLAFQTESRMAALDMRLNDAIALAAAATKNSQSDWSVLAWLVDRAIWAVCLPFSALMAGVLWPVRTVAGLLGFNLGSADKERRERSGSRKRHLGPGSQWGREREVGSGTGGDMRRGGSGGIGGTNREAAGFMEKIMMGGQRTDPLTAVSSSDRLFGRFGKR
ncbi:hypothetical protein V8F20_005034 [Naviculisporaceae sp. PSN 640]